jgi:hypothetical protein
VLAYFYGVGIEQFKAVVELHQVDGLLSLNFYQYGQEEFSESAKKPIENIIKQSKSVFGKDVIVAKKVGWGSF